MMNGGKLSAFGWSLVIHGVLATGFLVTFRFNAPVQPQATGQIIQAEAISAEALEARERAKEQARQAELQREREAAERAAAEQRRREEAARQAELRRVEEARQRAEAQARRQREAEEARRAAAEAEAQRKAEAERRRQAEAEARRKAEEEARLKAQAEQRRREEAARREREQSLLQSLEAEERRTEAIQAGKQAQWIGIIQNKVMRNWSQPPNLGDDFHCEFEVRQIPGGEVVSVIARECDNEVLRRSAEAAIWKASPLPPPPDPSLFDQYVTVIFQPEG